MIAGKRKAPKKMSHVGPNMTPMVDVVMCILIFFMLGSTFSAQDLFLTSNMPAIEKGLGTIKPDQKLPPVRMKIEMHRQGNDTWISAFDSALLKMNKIDDVDQSDNEKILTYFEQKKSGIGGTGGISDDVQIIIVPDRLVPYQDVITIYDYCAKAKFAQVAFAPAK